MVAYEYQPSVNGAVEPPVFTGSCFNDAYRYMDLLLSVPILLLEFVFVMKLTPSATSSKFNAFVVS